MSRDLKRMAGRRLWVGIPDLGLDATTKTHLQELKPGGIVLFRRNVESLDQVRSLIGELRTLLGDELVVSVDHEGGLVTRFHRELTVFPGNTALGAASMRETSMGEEMGRQQGVLSARELRDLGIDVNLAPVLDLASSGHNPGITIRSFGASSKLVCKLGVALVCGTREGGVLPTLKHFPGKGEATVDAHLDLPTIPPGDQGPHLAPFRAAIEAGASIVMTSHVIFQEIDAEWPATLSPSVVQGVLRQDLGFDGVIVTDDMEMGAMQKNYGFDAMIRGAAHAGHDVFCICHSPDLQLRARDILVEGMEADAEWAGDYGEVDERLRSLEPPPASGTSNLGKGAELAEAISGRAITVVQDPQSLLPVEEAELLVAMPTVATMTGVENPLRGEEDGSVLLDALGSGVTHRSLPQDPSAEDIDALLAEARGYQRLLVVLTNARFLEGQRALAQSAAAEIPGTIILAIRSPFDLEVLPPGSRATQVATYGFRPMQLIAAARVMRGEVKAYGRLPVNLVPML